MSMFDNIRSQARRQGAPATYGIIGVAIVSFVISFLLQGARSDPLAFYSNWSQPWGLATYPFSLSGFGLSIIAFLFELWWFFWVGSSAERDLGTQKFVGVFFGSTVLAGIFLGVGLNILGIVV